ncbi:MAG: DUF4290 domain-containing protein [Muribaculum sp.]|nr:DUF4290 domain-containing protein [Muribaculum sp.]
METNDHITVSDNLKLIPYNTGNEPLPLPEYGRLIQQMVDHCVMIPDREERTFCAYSIVETMKTLFPKAITDKKNDAKFWDHLNIMSRYELDIDFPCEVAGPENQDIKPNRIPYNQSKFAMRHYGRMIERMVDTVAEMEPSSEREEMVYLLVNQMKKQLIAINPEIAENSRVIHDLERMSKGRIFLDPDTYFIPEYEDSADSKTGKGKKNKKSKLI